MIYLLENQEHWYKKFKMVPKVATCPKCNTEVSLCTPVISQEFIGLCSEKDCCPEATRIYELKPRSATVQMKLNEAFVHKKRELAN